MKPNRQAMLAAVTVALCVDTVTADISTVDLDDVVVRATGDQIAIRNGLNLEPDRSSEAAGVDHEATPRRVSAA